MPNLDLNNKGKGFMVDNEYKNFFKTEKVSYSTLTSRKSDLENKKNLSKEEKGLLDWINKKLKTEIQKNEGPKRARMNIDAEGTKRGVNGGNNFKNRTPNDTDNNNVGSVGEIVKINEEINSIKYLIEYMDNNKRKNL
jgi:hypothetical protein